MSRESGKGLDPFQEGYDSFKSEEKRTNPYIYESYQSPGYYFKCGWEKAEREYEEEQRLLSRPKCPHCRNYLEEKHSGYFCENVEWCGYHSHGKEEFEDEEEE